MPASKATTVAEYLRQLEPDRRAALTAVRRTINQYLPRGYKEGIGYGMIAWFVPLADYPDTPNRQPLGYVALAAQKSYNSLHLMGAYADPRQVAFLKSEFARQGFKLDMGKGCLRFKRAEDLPLDTIGKVIAAMPPAAFIARCEAAWSQRAAGRNRAAASRAKTAATKR